MKSFNEISIFKNFTKNDLILEPSPHVIIRNCLDKKLYNQLARTFPKDKEFEYIIKEIIPNAFNYENKRLSLYAYLTLNKKNRISKVWLEFIKFHTSKEFLKEFISIFEPYIYRYYPALKKKFKNIEDLNEQIRDSKNNIESDLDMDFQICVNTPSSSKSSVIQPHTDAGKELYAALLYFRHPDDLSKGGDLIIHKWKNKQRKKFIDGSMVKKNLIEEYNLIKYEPNTLVFFLNTVDFVHSVSPRDPSIHSRRFVNIIADLPSSDLQEDLLYPKEYAWGKHKFKLLIRSILVKIGILKYIKLFFKINK